MSLDLADCDFAGPALPGSFTRHDLEPFLIRQGLLPARGGRPLDSGWDTVRLALRSLGEAGGPRRVYNHVLAPLAPCLGYAQGEAAEPVATREGPEDGGWMLRADGGACLRTWPVAADMALDAPRRRGRGYRFSPARAAQRILFARNESAGLLTDGAELRLLLCDPARADSQIVIPLTGPNGWRNQAVPPDSFRLLIALASPGGQRALPDLLDAARLSQTRVTKALRVRARVALEGFIRALLAHPANAAVIGDEANGLAAALWREGLILIYRLLFILKLEASTEAARGFSFAASRVWRHALSPNLALGPLVRRHLDQGHDTGAMLEDGLRMVFHVFRDGLNGGEIAVPPLGGALFGAGTAPLLDRMAWGERAVAMLLDNLLWTVPRGGERERVHYGALDVEELGHIYEALLELEPGIATVPITRRRRGKLEAVVPRARAAPAVGIERVEDIAPGGFFLRAGLGRKATGSYYTPSEFVRYLVRETLGPRIALASPPGDPNPAAILALNVVDPAVGTGHFLVEACRYLGDALYDACRACDEKGLHIRLAALPDRDRMLLSYLPSRSCEDADDGVSRSRAMALCRRMVAVHCLYGVDRNPLAVELAKLSLWLEAHADGLPLTFLDHRLVVGDSLAGPFLSDLAHFPAGGGILDPLMARGVMERLAGARDRALREIRVLESSVGRDVADLTVKAAAKARLDAALEPMRRLARAWAGAMMTRGRESDDEWLMLARHVAETGAWPAAMSPRQTALLAAGERALSWDLAFPEIFPPNDTGGFDAVLGNPPWDTIQYQTKDFVAAYDLGVLDPAARVERGAIAARVLNDPDARDAFEAYRARFTETKRVSERLFHHQKAGTGKSFQGGNLDLYRLFAERAITLARDDGAIGILLPAAFHANEGATAVRRLYFQQTRLEQCLSFENRRGLFDIHQRVRFDLLIARRPGPTQDVRCAFWLDGLARAREPDRVMTQDRGFIEASGGDHMTMLELASGGDLTIARQMFTGRATLGTWCGANGIQLGRDLHMTDDAARFSPAARARPDWLVLHEGKTFHQYTGRWDTAPRYALAPDALAGKPAVRDAAGFYRLAFREITQSTNERTMIAFVAPPGTVFSHTATVERSPAARPNATALGLCAIFNSFPFDWLARLKAGTHLSLYMVNALPLPALSSTTARFLAHAALRLSYEDSGYAPLWREQVGPGAPDVLDEEARRRLRAAVDAVTAAAYGLDRVGYERILSSFSHRSFPAAPDWCLAAYDRLASIGPARFQKENDPFAGMAMVTALSVRSGNCVDGPGQAEKPGRHAGTISRSPDPARPARPYKRRTPAA